MKTSVKGFARGRKKYFERELIQCEARGDDCMFCSTSESYFISLISFAALSTHNDSQDYYKVPFFPQLSTAGLSEQPLFRGRKTYDYELVCNVSLVFPCTHPLPKQSLTQSRYVRDIESKRRLSHW